MLVAFSSIRYQTSEDHKVQARPRSRWTSCEGVGWLRSRRLASLILTHRPTKLNSVPNTHSCKLRKSFIHFRRAGSNLALRIHICHLFPFIRIWSVPSESHAQLWLLAQMSCWSICCFKSPFLVISVCLSFTCRVRSLCVVGSLFWWRRR
jgi:hypothetical protein